MAYCVKCGNELKEGSAFCNSCGTPVNSNVGVNSPQERVKIDGTVHKCPNCGSTLDSFVTKCPSCGYEIRGAKVSQSVTQFVDSLQAIKDIDERVTLILNYTIPNVKEDIVEFMFKTKTNIKAEQDAVLFEAWATKFEEAYEKAKFMLSSDTEFEKIKKMYSATETTIQIKRIKLNSKAALKKHLKNKKTPGSGTPTAPVSGPKPWSPISEPHTHPTANVESYPFLKGILLCLWLFISFVMIDDFGVNADTWQDVGINFIYLFISLLIVPSLITKTAILRKIICSFGIIFFMFTCGGSIIMYILESYGDKFIHEIASCAVALIMYFFIISKVLKK